MKVCRDCNIEKDESEFHSTHFICKDGSTSLRPNCKNCYNATRDKRRQNNIEGDRKKNLETYYKKRDHDAPLRNLFKFIKSTLKLFTKEQKVESETKVCKLCNEEKSSAEFYKTGWGYCKSCHLKVGNEYRQEHKEEINKKHQERRAGNPKIRFKNNFGSAVQKQVKSRVDYFLHIGYSFDELIINLESKFEPGMAWNNYGPFNSKTFDINNKETWTWLLMNIIPKNKFEINFVTDQSFKDCWNFSNIRPSWSQDILEQISSNKPIKPIPTDGNKTCTKCLVEKPLCEFKFRKDYNNYNAQCKPCADEANSKFSRIAKYKNISTVEYMHDEIAKLHQCYECVEIKPFSEFGFRRDTNNITNICHSCAYQRKKLKFDSEPGFRLRENFGRQILHSLKSNGSSKEGFSCFDKLSYTFQEFKNHIISLFEPWMTLENHGNYRVEDWNDNDPSSFRWQLDHYVPISFFKFSSMDDEGFKLAWALRNLRPISAKQNVIENNKRFHNGIDQTPFPQWVTELKSPKNIFKEPQVVIDYIKSQDL